MQLKFGATRIRVLDLRNSWGANYGCAAGKFSSIYRINSRFPTASRKRAHKPEHVSNFQRPSKSLRHRI